MKTTQQNIEKIMEDFKDRFQQAEDDFGYFGWERETEFSDLERWLVATLTQVIQQAREEERERIIKKIEYLVNRAEGENKMIPPKLLRNLFLTPAK